MKNCILILIAVLFFNCSSDDDKSIIENKELLGKWKGIELLADPGDGSGTFQPVAYNRTIEFFNDGKVIANGTLCFMSSESTPSSGTFTLISESEFSEGEIIPNDCNSDFYKISFKIEDSNLVLWYPCIKGCGEKFEKVE